MRVSFNIDRRLMGKLSGKQEEQDPAQKKKRAPVVQGPTHHGLSRVQKRAMEAIRKDAELRYSLASASKVGDLLVKREAGEVPKVNEFAEELLQKYKKPSRAVPCEKEKEACVECYKAGGDILKCSRLVDAYGKCAQDAWKDTYSS